MNAKLTEGPIGKTLLRLSNPMVLGMFAVISLNLVDTYFIARLGTDQLAAVSFTFPVVILLMNLALGLSIGTGSLVSRAIGAGDFEKAKRITSHSLLLGIGVMTLLAAIGLYGQEPLFKLFLAPDPLIPYIREYMDVWLMGIPLIVIPMVGNAAIGSTGDTRSPGIMMCFAALLNLILDPILIFTLGMGVRGAAIATVISYGSAVFISLAILGFGKKLLTLSMEGFINSSKRILAISLPAAGSQMIVPLTHAVTIWMLAHFGAEVVAAYGIASRLEAFVMIVIFAMSSSLAAFVGQNWGANQFARVKRGVQIGFLFATFWGVGVAFVLWLGSTVIPTIFNEDPEVVRAASTYLQVVPIGYAGVGCLFVATAFLNAIGRPIVASVIAITRHVILYIPLAYCAMQSFGPTGIFFVIALVNLVVGASLVAVFNRSLQSDISSRSAL